MQTPIFAQDLLRDQVAGFAQIRDGVVDSQVSKIQGIPPPRRPLVGGCALNFEDFGVRVKSLDFLDASGYVLLEVSGDTWLREEGGRDSATSTDLEAGITTGMGGVRSRSLGWLLVQEASIRRVKKCVGSCISLTRIAQLMKEVRVLLI